MPRSSLTFHPKEWPNTHQRNVELRPAPLLTVLRVEKQISPVLNCHGTMCLSSRKNMSMDLSDVSLPTTVSLCAQFS